METTTNTTTPSTATDTTSTGGTQAATTASVSVSVAMTDDQVKSAIAEFLTKNSKLEWSQKTAGYCLAYAMVEIGLVDADRFKDAAKFLTQDSLHGLAGNASQFRQWYFGKSESRKKVEIDELLA
jgi:hypothetical protein